MSNAHKHSSSCGCKSPGSPSATTSCSTSESKESKTTKGSQNGKGDTPRHGTAFWRNYEGIDWGSHSTSSKKFSSKSAGSIQPKSSSLKTSSARSKASGSSSLKKSKKHS